MGRTSPAWVLGRAPIGGGSEALCLLPQPLTLCPEHQAALARGPESPHNRVYQQRGGSPDPHVVVGVSAGHG